MDEISRLAKATITTTLVASITALITLSSGSLSAAAETPHLLLSSDGINFAPALTGALFDGLGLLIPQESLLASVWIKNPMAHAVALHVSITGLVSPSSAFADSVTLSATDSTTGTSHTSVLADLSTCEGILPSIDVPAGNTTRIDFTVAMLDVTGMTAQDEVGEIKILLGIRDSAAGVFDPSGCDSHLPVLEDGAGAATMPGKIPVTGYRLPEGLVVTAAAITSVGALLVLSRALRSRCKP
ncbi:MAG: cell wall anchor protein [Homoserinimonas sp.]|nr:cell wall anchor protein [Homoserinimonas sp.]